MIHLNGLLCIFSWFNHFHELDSHREMLLCLFLTCKRIGQYLLSLSNPVIMRFKQIISIKGNRSCLPNLLKTNDQIILANPVTNWVISLRFCLWTVTRQCWFSSLMAWNVCYINTVITIWKWFCLDSIVLPFDETT